MRHAVALLVLALLLCSPAFGADSNDPVAVYPVPCGPRHLAVDEEDNIYVTCGDATLQVLSPEGQPLRTLGGKGSPLEGLLQSLEDLEYYKGKLYLVDSWFERVVVISREGALLDMLGGSGFGRKRFSFPRGVTVQDDVIYVSDTANGRIQVFGINGVYSGEFGAGLAGEGALRMPGASYMAPSGDFFVVDQKDQWVKRYRGGSYVSMMHTLREPGTITGFPGGLAVSDMNDTSLRIFDTNFRMKRFMGKKGEAAGRYRSITGLAVDSRGRLIVSDYMKKDLKVFSLGKLFRPDLAPTQKPGESSSPPTALWLRDLKPVAGDFAPGKLLLSEDGTLYCLEPSKATLWALGKDGSFITKIPLGNLKPRSFALAPEGGFWVLERSTSDMLKLSPTGEVLLTVRNSTLISNSPTPTDSPEAGAPSAPPNPQAGAPSAPSDLKKKMRKDRHLLDAVDIAVDKEGRLYLADRGAGSVKVFSSVGEYLGVLGRGGTEVFVEEPVALALDRGGTLYVLDASARKVLMYSTRGLFIRELGWRDRRTPMLGKPVALAITEDSVIVLDRQEDSLKGFTKSGYMVYDVGASGSGKGDFLSPSSVAALTDGTLLVSDPGNRRIQALGLRLPEGYLESLGPAPYIPEGPVPPPQGPALPLP